MEEDQPQVRIWPPQLSSHGFPAVFHRLVHRNRAGWRAVSLGALAGATPPRPRTVLLGLGLWTEEPTTIGRLAMEPRDWTLSLHVQSLEADPLEVNATPEQQAAPSRRRCRRARAPPFRSTEANRSAPAKAPSMARNQLTTSHPPRTTPLRFRMRRKACTRCKRGKLTKRHLIRRTTISIRDGRSAEAVHTHKIVAGHFLAK